MWIFLLFIHSFLLFQEDVEFLTDEGAGWGLEATLQLTATILLCLTVKILPETLIYKAQPSKQAEPFLPRSQGRAHWEHTVPWCGQCGCSGCSQPWPGWGLMASWEKAWLEVPLLYLSSLTWGPGKPKLMLGISGLGAAAPLTAPRIADFTPFQLFSYGSTFQTLGQESCPGWKCHVFILFL